MTTKRTQARSFLAISRRAVSRLCEGKDFMSVMRIHEKARDLREWRSAQAYLDTLARPHGGRVA